MSKKIKRDYKEIAKTNTFMANAAEIREICLVQNVDIGVAVDMYITNHHLHRTEDLMRQSREFLKCCREKPLKEIVAELEK